MVDANTAQQVARGCGLLLGIGLAIKYAPSELLLVVAVAYFNQNWGRTAFPDNIPMPSANTLSLFAAPFIGILPAGPAPQADIPAPAIPRRNA